MKQLANGDILSFGKFDWRVLDRRDGQIFLLCKNFVNGKYHEKSARWFGVTWSDCTLRKYLNNDFLNIFFSQAERDRIVKTSIINKDNPWFGTNGGNSTVDKVFLLSLDEVVTYFGDSGQLKNKNPNSSICIDDEYNNARLALINENYDKYQVGSHFQAWWLRSPGMRSRNAAYVGHTGEICVHGVHVDNYGIYIRPAMWVRQS